MIPIEDAQPAAELSATRWFNADAPIRLAELRGRVVAIEGFQMLCPGCVMHGMPQAQTIAQVFAGADVTVLGLHTVFENHAAMTPVALETYLHEFRVGLPVGVDDHAGNDPTPLTMRAYRSQGTPTLWLIDRAGRLRASHFGQTHDMVVGAEIAALLAEPLQTA